MGPVALMGTLQPQQTAFSAMQNGAQAYSSLLWYISRHERQHGREIVMVCDEPESCVNKATAAFTGIFTSTATFSTVIGSLQI
jgi:hypothetical protein